MSKKNEAGFGLLEVLVAGAIMTITTLVMFGSMNYLNRTQKNTSQLSGFDTTVGTINRLLANPVHCANAFKNAWNSTVTMQVDPGTATHTIPEISIGSGAGATKIAGDNRKIGGGMYVEELQFMNPVPGPGISMATCTGPTAGWCNSTTWTLFLRAKVNMADSGTTGELTGGATERRAKWVVTLLTNQVAGAAGDDHQIMGCSGGSAGSITGTGAIGRMAMFTSTSGVGDSAFYQTPTGTTGNVGLGTITPSGQLDILSTGDTSGAGVPQLRISHTGTANTSYASIQLKSDTAPLGTVFKNSSGQASYGGAGSVNIGTAGAENFSVITNNVSRLFVHSGGGVRVGGTGTGAPISMLQIAQAADLFSSGILVYGTDTVNNPYLAMATTSATTSLIQSGNSSVWTRLNLNPNGGVVAVGPVTGAPTDALSVEGDLRLGITGAPNGCVRFGDGVFFAGNCVSDIRLKRNLSPMRDYLDRVTELEPTFFEFRWEEHPPGKLPKRRVSGLIAQQVQKIFPELVHRDQDGFLRVNYAELPLMLLQSLRELYAKVREGFDRQGREIAELRRQNAELVADQSRLRERLEKLEKRLER